MYHSFLIHSSAVGHLGCFHVLAMINSAAMNIGVHVSLPSSLVKIFGGKCCSAALKAGTQKVLRKSQLIAAESQTLCLPWCRSFPSRSEMMAVCLFTHSANVYSAPPEKHNFCWGLGLQGTNQIPGFCSYGDGDALGDLSIWVVNTAVITEPPLTIGYEITLPCFIFLPRT